MLRAEGHSEWQTSTARIREAKSLNFSLPTDLSGNWTLTAHILQDEMEHSETKVLGLEWWCLQRWHPILVLFQVLIPLLPAASC